MNYRRSDKVILVNTRHKRVGQPIHYFCVLGKGNVNGLGNHGLVGTYEIDQLFTYHIR